MKLLIIGHGRHGKDTVAEILRDYHGWSFRSSSHWAAEHVIAPLEREAAELYGARSWQQLYEHRHREDLPRCGRKFWRDAMRAYNKERGGTAIARGVLTEADVYVGMRTRCEFEAAMTEGLFDHVIWVDRSEHLPPESSDSMELTPQDANIHIDNNGSLKDLWFKVYSLDVKLRDPRSICND